MSRQSPARSRRPKSRTRIAILERAQEMYVDRELTHGDERLSAVLEDLGYTTGAGYQIWSNQAEFRRDLQVFVAERLEPVDLSGIAEKLRSEGHDDVERLADALAASVMDRLLDSDDFFLSLRFFGMDQDRPDEVTAALMSTADRFVEAFGELLAEVLGLGGRRMRSDVELRVLAESAAALLHGLALQHRVERRSSESTVRSAAALGLTSLLLGSSEPGD